MKKRVMAMVLAIATVFAGCGGSSSSSSKSEPVAENSAADRSTSEKTPVEDSNSTASSDSSWTFGYIPMFYSNSWQVQALANFQGYCDEDGIKYLCVDPDGDVDAQINAVQNMIDAQVDAIVIEPLSEAVTPICEEAEEAGIIVITMDTVLNSDKITCQIATDTYSYGVITAQAIVDYLGKEGGRVLMLDGTAGASTSEERSKGADDVFAENPQIEVVARANCDFDQALAQQTVANWITVYSDIDAVWSQGGQMTAGAYTAYQQAGMPCPFIIGETNNGFLKYWADNMDDGFHAFGVNLRASNLRVAVEVAKMALNGEKVPAACVPALGTVTDDTVLDFVDYDKDDDFWCADIFTVEEAQELIAASF